MSIEVRPNYSRSSGYRDGTPPATYSLECEECKVELVGEPPCLRFVDICNVASRNDWVMEWHKHKSGYASYCAKCATKLGKNND